MKKLFHYFTTTEKVLWLSSVATITLAFLLFDRENVLTLLVSLIGVTALIFNAKGNPIGQVLIIIFAVFYGFISYSFRYYGEMMTYLGMSLPMAVLSLVSWLRNPYKGNVAEVKVNRLGKIDTITFPLLTIAVTTIFYFLLRHFHTPNLLVSTFSVATSFSATYLVFRRSPYFALAYALNDIVLIVLWTFASFKDVGYVSVVACFFAFLFHDCYSFYNWRKMRRRQAEGKPNDSTTQHLKNEKE